MRCWNTDLYLKRGQLALRILQRKEHFFIPPDLKEPQRVKIFEPSTTDIAHGAKRDMQPLISLWDKRVPFMELLRRRKLLFHKTAAFELDANKVNSLGYCNPIGIPICIIKDPLPKDIFGRFHYGVQGLYYDSKNKTHKSHKAEFIISREKILDLTSDYKPTFKDQTMGLLKCLKSLILNTE